MKQESWTRRQMGHSEALVEQVLDSGTRATTVTITDPKVGEGDAFEQMLKDLVGYHLYLRRHSRHSIQAASVAEADDGLHIHKRRLTRSWAAMCCACTRKWLVDAFFSIFDPRRSC